MVQGDHLQNLKRGSLRPAQPALCGPGEQLSDSRASGTVISAGMADPEEALPALPGGRQGQETAGRGRLCLQ